MRRLLKWVGGTIAALILLPVILLAAALFWLTTGTGHAYIAGLVAQLTSGEFVARDFTGSLFTAPRFGSVEIRDADGAWAVVHDFGIDWSPLDLLHRDVKLVRVSASRIEVLRQPLQKQQPASSKPSSWYGFRVDIDTLQVGRIELAPTVAVAPAALAAEGSVHLASPTEGTGELALTRLDSPGTYSAKGDVAPTQITAALSAQEPAHGLIATAAHLPDIGPLAVNATLAGPTAGAATTLSVAAGELRAAAHGNVDLDHGAVDLDLTASAPAMAPRPDLSWRSVSVDAHVHGPYATPDATATIRVGELAASGGTVRLLAADVGGNAGHLTVKARAEGIRVPGPSPDLLAAAPLVLDADARLDAPGRPINFTLSHPLMAARGSADTAAPMHGQVALQLHDIAPLAAVANQDLRGHAALDLTFATAGDSQSVTADGTVAISGGLPQATALIGESARIGLSASVTGQDIALSHFHLDGRALTLSAQGRLESGTLDLDWKAALADLHAAVPTLTGRITAEGHVQGPQNDLAVKAKASGEVGGDGVPRGPVQLAIDLHGLPAAPVGHVAAEGELNRAPLALAVDLKRTSDGTIHLTIDRADWKSAHAEGTLTLANGATLPEGRIALRMTRIEDLRPFVGAPVGGGLDATLELAHDRAHVQAELRGARLPGQAEIASATLTANVADPITHPTVDANLIAAGVRSGTLSGNMRVELHGPEERLALQLAAKLDQLAGAPADVTAGAVANAKAKDLTLASLQATWKGTALRLLAPARVDFGATTAVEHLRLGLGQAVLEANGRIGPTLDFQLALSNVTPDLTRSFVPTLRATGTLGAQARLTGSLTRPVGTARLTATGLHMLTGPGQVLPPANLSATANLDGRTARIDAHLAAGTATQLTLTGSAPLEPAGAIDLRAGGRVDLAMVNPLTEAQGIRVRGQVTLNAGVTGTLHSPSANGTMQLVGGEVQDFAQGAHLTDIQATLQGAGDTLRLSQFTARAGEGTVSGSGTVGVLAPGIPIALTVTMNNAKPLASNLLTATLDADVSLNGHATTQLRTAGTIRIRRADINVPEHLPRTVAVLNVRVAGQPPPPPPPPGPNIALDLNLNAPRAIFVRGRGLNAELGGTLHVSGTAKTPQPSGSFQMIRGQYSLAGTTLDFTEGSITFSGRGNIGGERIDPALHFVATSSSANVTATLIVGGYASDPKITLSSVPQLPQDEILAHLLFGQSVANLSPFQIAEIGSTLAELSGISPGGIGDPLNRLRNTLGLDRLTIGTNPVNPAITPGTQQNNTNTVVEAGRYVAPGVYVGAKQGLTGTGQQTEATVQIDLTKHLKLQTGVGSGLGANNIGLTYQFQY